MIEMWKDIEGYKGYYQISNTGKVKSLPRIIRSSYNSEHISKEKILKPSTDKDGYLKIALYIDGKCKQYFIHRLIAIHFIPNPKEKPVVNHINGIKKDNRIDNLEWATGQENIQHAWDTGLSFITEKRREATKKSNKTHKGIVMLNIQTGIYYDSIRDAAKSINKAKSTLLYKMVNGTQENFIYA